MPGAASIKLRGVDKLNLLLRSYRIDVVILPKSNSDVRLRSAIFPARRCRTYLTAEE
jgi:hypothetical protein